MTPSTVTGKVVVASTGEGVAGVQADLYSSGNGVGPGGHARRPTDRAPSRSAACRPAATGCAFTGAGFDEQWYAGVA